MIPQQIPLNERWSAFLSLFEVIVHAKILHVLAVTFWKKCASLSADWNDPEIENELQEVQMPEGLSDFIYIYINLFFNGLIALKFIWLFTLFSFHPK